MNVCIVIPSFYPAVIYGGPIFSTLSTCEELAKFENFNVTVVTTNTNSDRRLDVATNKWISLKNFRVKYYNETVIGKFSLQLFVNLWRDIKESDVIHIQSVFSLSTPWALLLSKFNKKPVLFSPRGSLGVWGLNNGSKIKSIWLKLFIEPFSNSIVWHSTSFEEKKDILKLFPYSQVELIPNGIHIADYDLDSAPQDFYKKYLPKNMAYEKIVISMGRLQKVKGFDILIKSFLNVLSIYPNAKLLIAGPDEGERNNLLNLIELLELNDSVFLIGNVDGNEKLLFLNAADVFALPSHSENFGNVYLESLASGTPIVASQNTPWEIVEDYTCGRWVPNDVENTSKSIIEILSKEKVKMRANSKKLANNYDWSSIGLTFKNLFKSMAK